MIENGFCVLRGLIGMFGRGIFFRALANDHIYCQKGVYR